MEQTHIQSQDIKRAGLPWRIARLIGLGIGGVALAAVFALVLGIVVQWLWNWLMPDIFGLKQISYWQAFGLLFLGKLLFGGFGHHHPASRHHPHRLKDWANHGGANHWKHYDRFWREKGHSAADTLIDRAQGEESPKTENSKPRP